MLFEWFIALVVIVLSSVVQTAVGFGLAIIAVPILVLIDPNMVPAPIVIVAFFQLWLNLYAHRAHVNWKPLLWAFVGRVPGTVAAVLALRLTGEAGLQWFIGLAVLMAVIISLSKWRLALNRRNHFFAGMASGFTGTTSAIGGPPIALLYQHQTGDTVRANLSAYFIVGSVMSIIGMGAGGLLTMQSWLYAGAFLIPTFVGVWIGLRVKHLLKPTFMRPAMLILCGTCAVVVLAQAVRLTF
ncbi:sulfite exporter TauE/SafE family protein [Salinibius halmophilus]|uniref:sulfite exporter TauE/SafE family protein n=1 Tax=Salinibius halmophilus TaxID=1853216 RepID=UPI0013144948|nr:sulfite exporter TauE/SafE family protein [Salinibius halmophilus]